MTSTRRRTIGRFPSSSSSGRDKVEGMSESQRKDGAPADADAKEKFRNALERKKGKQHPHEAASQNSSKANDAHSAAGAKRMFRRKSGGRAGRAGQAHGTR